MSLIDKIGQPSVDLTKRRLRTHLFAATLDYYARGLANRAQVITAAELESSDEAQLDMLLTAIDGQPNAAAKERYSGLIWATAILLEEDKITKGQASAALGL